jgi:hypothetical protein
MRMRTVAAVALVVAPCLLKPGEAPAQDVPGIEICTVEKTMERRTSCLQSNVNFLQKTITKLSSDSQQKLDAANRQIETLKSAVASLQKTLDDLQAAQKNKDAAPVKDTAPAKEGAK